MQRIEVLLPVRYNPNVRGKRKSIPIELFRITKNELMEHFAQEGLSFEFVIRTRTYGEWKGIEDESLLIKIDVKMKSSDPAWLRQYKEMLKQRFQQDEIYIVYYDLIVV
jgi:hypothetical protein